MKKITLLLATVFSMHFSGHGQCEENIDVLGSYIFTLDSSYTRTYSFDEFGGYCLKSSGGEQLDAGRYELKKNKVKLNSTISESTTVLRVVRITKDAVELVEERRPFCLLNSQKLRLHYLKVE